MLRFDHEVIMSGRSLPRPINYYLSRIVPPPEMPTDQRKRPVVVVDPRAGQGPGVGGFKAQSEIGDALAAGHPVYFIGFGAKPEPAAGACLPQPEAEPAMLRQMLTGVRTISTEHVAWRATNSATLPSRKRLSPLCP